VAVASAGLYASLHPTPDNHANIPPPCTKLKKSFVCIGFVNPVIRTGHTNVGIGVNAYLELVDKFCYLGGDGDVDAAVETRI